MRKKILALLVIVLTSTLLIAFYAYSKSILQQIEPLVAQKLEESLQERVQIGTIQIEGYDSLKLTDVVVFDQSGQTMIETAHLTLKFFFTDLLWQRESLDKALIHTIKTVTLADPQLHLRQKADGTWNMEEIPQSKDPSKPRLRAEVLLDNGLVTLSLKQGTWQLDHLQGQVNLVHDPAIEGNLTGQLDGQELALKASVVDQKARFDVNLNQLDLTLLNPLLNELPIELLQGQVAQTEVHVEKNGSKWQILGQTELNNLDVDAQGIPVRHGEGLVVFSSNKINFYRTEAQVAGQTVKVNGQVYYDGQEPLFALNLALPELNLGQLRSSLPQFAATIPADLSGRLQVETRVEGAMSQWTAQGSVQWHDLYEAGYASSFGRTTFTANSEQVVFDDMTAQLALGQVTGQGQFELKSNRLYSQFQFSGVNLASLPVATEAQVAGQASGQVVLTGTLKPQALLGQGVITLSQGSLKGLPFTEVQLSFNGNQDKIDIAQLNVQSPVGALQAQGQYNQGSMTGQFACVDLDLAKVEAMLPNSWRAKLMNSALSQERLSGKVTASGTLAGTVSAPKMSLDVTARNGSLKGQPFDLIVGQLQVDGSAIQVSRLDWFWQNNQQPRPLLEMPQVMHHEIAGTVEWAGAKKIDLKGKTRQARGETLQKVLAKPLYLTGNIDADWTIGGTVDQPEAQIQATLNRGSLEGLLISSAQAFVQYKEGRTEVQKVRLKSFDADILCTGNIDAEGNLNLSLLAQNLSLSGLTTTLPYSVKGQADFSGDVTGTLNDIEFAGSLKSPQLTVKNLDLRQVQGKIQFKNSQVTLQDWQFALGSGQVSLAGEMNLVDKTTDGTAEITGVPVDGLTRFFEVPVSDLTGQLNSQVRWAGTFDNPEASLSGSLQNLKVRNRSWDKVKLNVELLNHVLKLNQVEGQKDQSRLVAQGTADLTGPIAVSLYGLNVDAGFLADLASLPLKVTGSSLFTVQLSGTVAKPRADISLGITQGSLNDTEFDNLNVTAVGTKQELDIQQMSVLRGPYEADVYGRIPLSVLNQTGDQMDLTMELSRADLNIFSFLTPLVKEASGPLQGRIKLQGTLSQPKLSGQIVTQGGSVQLKGLKEPLQNLSIAIDFEDDKMKINQFTATMGKGQLRLDGQVQLGYLTGQALPGLKEYDLALELQQLELKNAYFTGPLSAKLNLKQAEGQPLLQGQIVLDQDTIDIPLILNSSAPLPPVKLDITTEITKKTRFYNALLYDFYGEGQLHVQGTLGQPTVLGKYMINRGQVTYLTSPFRIDSGTAEFKAENGVIPALNLQAHTKIEQTDVTLSITGLATNMNLHLTANPTMSQQEIFSLLTLRGRYFDQKNQKTDSQLGRDQVSSIVSSSIEAQIFGPVENQFRSWFGLDDFHVYKSTINSSTTGTAVDDKSTLNRDVYNIELSKYLSDKFLLSYTLGVDHKSSSLGLTYEFNKRFSTTASVSNDNKIQFDVLARFPF